MKEAVQSIEILILTDYLIVIIEINNWILLIKFLIFFSAVFICEFEEALFQAMQANLQCILHITNHHLR